jgi:hypothetical protein
MITPCDRRGYVAPLLCRFRGLALFAAVVGPASTVPLMEGMLNVCHGAVLSLVHSFEGL